MVQITEENSTVGVELDGFSFSDLLAGDSIFTVTVLRARDVSQIGASFTYRVSYFEYKDEATDRVTFAGYSVKVLTGPNNLSDYQRAGMLTIPMGAFKTTKSSNIGVNAPSVKLISWLSARLASGADTSAVRVVSAGRCLRCGRVLTRDDSIRARYGRVCAGKIGE